MVWYLIAVGGASFMLGAYAAYRVCDWVDRQPLPTPHEGDDFTPP